MHDRAKDHRPQLPRQNPDFYPGGAFTAELQAVWDLCDGLTPIDELASLSGRPREEVLRLLASLRQVGAILWPGENPNSVAGRVDEWDRVKAQTARPPTEPLSPRPSDLHARARRTTADELELEPLSEEEARAVAEEVALTARERRRIIAFRRRVVAGDYFDLLEVSRQADRRALKQAYFRLSKEFHPDRHFARRTGAFGPWLREIFEGILEAYRVLSNPNQRAAYEAGLDRDQAAQTPEEHAAELFAWACAEESRGEIDEALRFFSAALRAHARPSYVRRAAMCALRSGRLADAEKLASLLLEVSPRDPSSARILADVQRATGELAAAADTLLAALDLATGNDILRRELQADLDEIQQLLQTASG